MVAKRKINSYLTIHCTSQDHSRRNDTTSGFLKLLKDTSVKVVNNENRVVAVVNHMLKAGVRVCDLATKTL